MKKELALDHGTLIIDLSPLGTERYFYKGKLLLKRWSYRFNQDVQLDIEGKVLLIEFRAVSKKGCCARVTYDSKVLVENIFEEMFDRVQSFNKKMERANKFIRPVSITLVILALALHGYVKFVG